MNDSGNRWMDDLTRVVAAAAKSNAELMKQGIELLQGTFIQPSELSRILTEGSSIVSRGFVDYIRLNVEHVQRVIELGRTLSNDLFTAITPPGETTKAPATEQQGTGEKVNELRMEGAPGDLCRSAFVLESKKSASVSARVRSSRFVNDADNTAVSIALSIDPVEKPVAPGEKVRFTVEAGIPVDMPSGTFHTMVWIEGFPEVSLRIVLTVRQAPVDVQTPTNVPAIPKKPKKTHKQVRDT